MKFQVGDFCFLSFLGYIGRILLEFLRILPFRSVDIKESKKMSAKAMPFSKFPIKLEDQTPLLLDLWFSLSARERTNRFVDSKTAAEFAAVSQ
jgi:hypothetical protein